MELKDRLRLARKNANMTQSKLAEAIGLSQANINGLESGKYKTSTKIVEIARVLRVNADWLANGQGGMALMPQHQGNVSPGRMPIEDWDSETPLDADEVEIPFYKDFAVACGHGSEGYAMANEWRKLRISRATIDKIGSHKDQVFATVAEGDSMAPIINDGDTIWIDESKQNIKDGKIFVFEYGGLYMCKRLFRLPNDGIRVVSENPDPQYDDWEITGEDRVKNNFRLIGWVWHWSVMERW